MQDRLGQAELAATAIRLGMGAGNSIAVKARYADGREFGLNIEDVAYSVDNRLALRCILPLPGVRRERDGTLYREGKRAPRSLGELRHSLRALEGAGWQVRLIPDAPLVSSLIADGDGVIFYEYLNDDPGPFFSSEERQVRHYLGQFEHHWSLSFPASSAEELYDRAEVFDRDESATQIAVVSHEAWSRLIVELSLSPEKLHALDPRKFEELVAELLARDGLEIHLTASTRDGGRDILAFQETPVGKHLYLVECKRHNPHRPVGVAVVRQLYGVITQERATAGLVVATSRFSREALTFAETVKHQMGLKDYDGIKAWLRSHVLAQSLETVDGASRHS